MRKGRSRPIAPQHANGAPQARAPDGGVRSICVYCGSSPGENPAYAAAARTLGRALAENGIRLVYGGGGLGLALVADFRVTCREARFSANFNRLGFHPGSACR